MKTKIIYISGNEVFDMRDIRAAFEEVRNALNLDKQTVLFGVPVDADDAGIMNKNETIQQNDEIIETVVENIPETNEDEINIPEIIAEEEIPETPVEEETTVIKEQEKPAQKKRGRPRKEEIIMDTDSQETPTTEDIQPTEEEKTIPILSVLSADDTNQEQIESVETTDVREEIDIIPEISNEKTEENIDTTTSITDTEDQDSEPDLEKLLSEMTPLQEDVVDEKLEKNIVSSENESDDVSVDATLEQLATEFAETQDKIHETKTSTRSRIGKLRNILPFKQSKHKDPGIGDLFEWGGIAANDEDFSVPGFFTNVASKK